ncbi:hypothetical protein GBAR_LOCUS14877 [Geodia barretti]|uniref:Uncharacterized protein n=1 Tax=Geodia barretti TaxID=519541 RepID=A0AA35WTC3_GEOBA|nr:hypothetical protein GBAR_LOCUS14877 [Geodia barretti]
MVQKIIASSRTSGSSARAPPAVRRGAGDILVAEYLNFLFVWITRVLPLVFGSSFWIAGPRPAGAYSEHEPVRVAKPVVVATVDRDARRVFVGGSFRCSFVCGELPAGLRVQVREVPEGVVGAQGHVTSVQPRQELLGRRWG